METIEEGFLTEPVGIIQGHIFADTSKNGKWMSNNPGHGRTNKNGKKYLWDDGPYPTYIEIARGLDFSELYQEGAQKPIDLSSMEQLRNQIKRI